MFKKTSFFATGFLVLCGLASAYTVSGSVSDDQGVALKGVAVDLLKEGKSATTDDQGKFTIHEVEQDAILSFARVNAAPIQKKVYNALGNLIFTEVRDMARGAYYAKIAKLESQKNRESMMKAAAVGETIRFVADGFDTLTVPLGTLDTTLNVSLQTSVPPEPKFSFGYALGNDPTPSKGCGRDSKLVSDKTVQNGKHYTINVNEAQRGFFITLPENYDNKKAYKLLFAMHCYGSTGEDFVHHTPDYDHPTPYYGQQVLDTKGDYIFVSGEAVGGLWNKGKADHDYFGEMLTAIEDNYCIDTSRVFVNGFSFGAMYTNSLAQDYQERIRAVAVYAVADYNIWLPQEEGLNKKLPIAWMAVHGVNDGRCDYNRAKNSALVRILQNNGKADANGNFTDASDEKPEEVQGNTGHVCYDFKTVDERFPVKFCTWPGDHQWTAHDTGNMSVGWGWESTWVPEAVHKFFEQF